MTDFKQRQRKKFNAEAESLRRQFYDSLAKARNSGRVEDYTTAMNLAKKLEDLQIGNISPTSNDIQNYISSTGRYQGPYLNANPEPRSAIPSDQARVQYPDDASEDDGNPNATGEPVEEPFGQPLGQDPNAANESEDDERKRFSDPDLGVEKKQPLTPQEEASKTPERNSFWDRMMGRKKPAAPGEETAEGAEGAPGPKRGGIGGMVDRAQEAINRAREAVKKKAKEAIDKIKKEGIWKIIVANAGWLVPVVIIVIIIIIAIVIFVALYNEGPKNGKSAAQPPSYMDDKDAIVALARKSGDPDIASEVASDVSDQMKQNLVLLKDSTTDAALLAEIDALVLKIEQNQGTMDTAVASEIITDFQTVMEDAANFQAPKLAVTGLSPLTAIIGYNEEIHFGTPLRKEMPTGNTTGHATYMHYGEGTADAVDLYVATDAPVLAPVAGKIIDLSDDGTGNKKIIINQGDYELLIAFVKPEATLAVGQNVTVGQALGTAAEVGGQSQIHLELAYCGKNITLDPVDKILADKEGKAIGEYLWNRFKVILNIP